MKGSTSLKGVHGIKSMQSIKKDAEYDSQNPDFLRLYMLEKERTRLRNERTRLQLRLEPIEARLKEIEEYYTATLGTKTTPVQMKIRTQTRMMKKWNGKTVGIKY